MTTDDFDLDDFDTDDFDLEFDDIEGSINPDIDNDDRTPVSQAISGSISGAKDYASDYDNIKKFIVNALPEEYGQSLDQLDEGVSNLSTLYDDSIKEVKPKLHSLTKKINRLIPEKHKRIKELLSKVEDKTSTFQYGGSTSSKEIDERSIKQATDSIFNSQKIEDKEKLLDETIQNKKDKVGFDLSTSIRDSIHKLTDYTTNVTQAYQKKSLELQYRSYFTQRSILEASNKYFEIFKAQNKVIVKNTSLPEYAKIQNIERFKELSKTRLIGGLQNKLFSDNGLVKSISSNVTSSIKDIVSGIGAVIDAGEGQASFMELQQEMADLTEGPEKSGSTKAGEFIGGGLAGGVTGKIASKIRDSVSKGGKILDAGKDIKDYMDDPTILKDKILDSSILKENDEDSFKKSDIKESIRGVISDLLSNKSSSFNSKVGGVTENLHDPAIYTNRTNKSIVEVIPGYLSRILKEITVLRTGDANQDLTVYDYTKGGFSTKKQLGSSIETNISNKLRANGVSRYTNDVTKNILSGMDVSPDDTKEANKVIQEAILNGNVSNVGSLKKHLGRSDTPIAKQLLEGLETNDSNHVINKSLRNTRSSFTDISSNILDSIDSGNKDILVDRGIITVGNNGRYTVNKDKYIDLLNKEPEPTSSQTTTSTSPTNVSNQTTPRRSEPTSSQTTTSANTSTIGGKLTDVLTKIDTKLESMLKYTSSKSDDVNTTADTKVIDALAKVETKLSPLGTIDSNVLTIKDMLTKGLTVNHMFSGNGKMDFSGVVSNTKSKFKSFTDVVSSVTGSILNAATSTIKGLANTATSGVKDVLLPGAKAFFESLTDKDGVLNGVIKSTLSLGKGLLDRSISAMDSILTSGKGAATFIYNQGKSLVKKALEYSGDIYGSAIDTPVLFATLMKAGHYLDEKTGDVIKSIKDIKGTVVDREGNIVLTVEDLKSGLKDRFGNKIKLPMEKILSFIKTTAVKGLGRLKGVYNAIKNGLPDISINPFSSRISEFSGKSYDVLVEIRDLVRSIAGLETPSVIPSVTTNTVTEQSGVSTNTTSNTSISNNATSSTVNNIKDKIKAAKDYSSKSIKRPSKVKDILSKGKDKLSNATKGKSSLIGGILSKGKSVLTGITGTGIANTASRLKDKLTDNVTKKTTTIKDLAKKGISKFNDTDGDGVRDNSATDRLKKESEREEARNKGPKAADLTEKYRGANVIDKMMGMVSGIGSKIGGMLEGLAAGGGISGILGGALSKIKGLFKGGGVAGKITGGIGKIAKGAGSVLSKAPKLLGTGGLAVARTGLTATLALGSTVGSSILGVFGSLAAATASVITSPIVLGGAAIAATGYGLFKGYKYLTRNDYDDYQAIRLHQYGLLLSEADKPHVHNLLSLEEYLDDKVGYNSGRAYFLERKIKLPEILELFSIDKDDVDNSKNMFEWFSKRFKPFYLTHMTALFAVDNKAKLDDLDDLDKQERIKYLNMVAFSDGPYGLKASPFKDIVELPNTLLLAKAAIDKLVGDIRTKLNSKVSKGDIDTTIKNADRVLNKSADKATNDHINKVTVEKQSKVTNKTYSVKKYVPPFTGEEIKNDTHSVVPEQKTTDSVMNTSKVPSRGGDVSKGEYGLDFIKLGPGVTLDGVNPNLLNNLKGMAQEYNEITGKTIQVNSAYRSAKLQAKLYRQNPHKAARPGKSLHGFGLAIDAQTVDLNKLDKLGLMRKYGFTRPVGGETWHMEPAGIQPYIQEAKINPGLADDLIKDSLGKGGGGVATVPGARKHGRNIKYALSLLKPDVSKDVSTSTATKDTLNITPSVKALVKDTTSNKSNVIPISKGKILSSNEPTSTAVKSQVKSNTKVAKVTNINDLPDAESKPSVPTVYSGKTPTVIDGTSKRTTTKKFTTPKSTNKVIVDAKQDHPDVKVHSAVTDMHGTLNDTLDIQKSMLDALNIIIQHTNPDNIEKVKASVKQAATRPTNTSSTPKPALNLTRRAV